MNKVLASILWAIALFSSLVLAQNRLTGQELNTAIENYEAQLRQCDGRRKSRQCADVMYTLGILYSDQVREISGSDFSRVQGMFSRFVREYPNDRRIPEIFFRMGDIYMLGNYSDLDTALIIFNNFIQRFPRSPLIPSAHYRLAEVYRKNGDCARALSMFMNAQASYPSYEGADRIRRMVDECGRSP